MTNQIYIDPLVNVVMPTYNHELYISEAIESVLLQRCDFNFRMIISDDCSTDNTFEIVKAYQKMYPEKIVIYRNPQNVGLINNYIETFNKCDAKYLAILETDDYWVDPNKLQEQVSIMENDPLIGLVHSRSATVYENGELKINYHLYESEKIYGELFADLINGSYGIVPLTVCFRRDLLKKLDFEFLTNSNLKTVDAFLWPEFSMHTKFKFLDSIVGYYRVLESSESNSKDQDKQIKFLKSSQRIFQYYYDKYGISNVNYDLIISNFNYRYVQIYLMHRNFEQASLKSQLLPMNNFRNICIRIISKWHFLIILYEIQVFTLNTASIIKQRLYKLIK